MNVFTNIAEQRIVQALEAGEFENLPGSGRPLNLDQEFNANNEHRLAFIILKNAGYLPSPLQIRKEIEQKQRTLQEVIEQCRQRTQNYKHFLDSEFKILGAVSSKNRSKVANKNGDAWQEGWRSKFMLAIAKLGGRKNKKQESALRKISKYICAHNATVQYCRSRYIEILEEINRKIAELNNACIKEEGQGTRKSMQLLALPFIDVEAKVQEFCTEFEWLNLPNDDENGEKMRPQELQ
ncbi:MAG: DUF1992 domain-containing protein [bacterium]